MKIIQFTFDVFTVLFLSGCYSSNFVQSDEGKQQSRTFSGEITKTVSAQYLIYLPNDYNENENFPLIIFLHGSGERGTDINKVKVHGPAKLIEQGKDFPFIVVSPQCPEEEWWSVDVLDGLLKEIIQSYNVDESRIYLTGLSMGGYGTWNFTQAFPEKFAAIAPICGGGNFRTACKLKNVPVWAFHGAKDPVVKIEESQKMVESIKKCGGNVEFTVYPEAGHDSWTETYNNPEFYEWLLKHSLK